MNGSKAKRRALALIAEAERTLAEARRELDPLVGVSMRCDDAQRLVGRAIGNLIGAQENIERSAE